MAVAVGDRRQLRRRAMGWDEILEGEGCPTNVIVQRWRTVSSHRREGVAEPPAIAAARRDLRRDACGEGEVSPTPTEDHKWVQL